MAHSGMAFLMPSGTYHNPNQKHLFVVCSDPDKNGHVLLASISSWKNDLCDASCKLANGCHPSVPKDSYVLYRKSRIEAAAVIEKGIKTGTLIQKDDFGADAVGKMVAGFIASKQTPWKIKKYAKSLNRRK